MLKMNAKTMKKLILIGLLKKLIIIAILFFTSSSVFSQIRILSGIEGGSYYQMALDIKKYVDTTIQVLPSEGNYYAFNQLRNLRANELDVVFLQYDVLYAGSYGFEDLEKIQNIKALLPLGKEDVHLITKKSNNINSIEDLKKKKVGVGTANQGTNITTRFIKDYAQGTWVNVRLPLDEAFEALEKGEIDAFFFVGSAPVYKLNNISETLAKELKLVPIKQESLEKIYRARIIKANTYKWLKEDVQSISLGYALVTNVTGETEKNKADLEKLLVGIKNNIEVLKTNGHPSWKDVDFTKFDRITCEIHDSSKKLFGIK